LHGLVLDDLPIFFVWMAAAAEGISPGKSSWSVLHGEHLQPPPITKPDTVFNEMGAEFVYGYEDVNLAELNDLFEKVCHLGHAAALLPTDKGARIISVLASNLS
jgi:hypothetical protein